MACATLLHSRNCKKSLPNAARPVTEFFLSKEEPQETATKTNLCNVPTLRDLCSKIKNLRRPTANRMIPTSRSEFDNKQAVVIETSHHLPPFSSSFSDIVLLCLISLILLVACGRMIPKPSATLFIQKASLLLARRRATL